MKPTRSAAGGASVAEGQAGPPKRSVKKAKSRTKIEDAMDCPDAGGKLSEGTNPVELLRRHSLKYPSEQDSEQKRSTEGRSKRADSQWQFADPTQTMIVFDWDDTLFPTTDILDVLELNWQVPLSRQKVKREVLAKIVACEKRSAGTLRRAAQSGHVVVVTLAAKGWVEQACRLFYPKVGELLKNLKIKIVNAQEPEIKGLVGDPSQYSSDEEYYGLLKGHAMALEVEQFYSQYKGQSWKNILSIGDARFERHGILAAATSYMQGCNMNAVGETPVLPTEQAAWRKVESDGHVVALRVKCCKLVDGPDIDELDIQLDMVSKWMHLMVALDEGFDLDFEALVNSELIAVVEGVLRGDRPVADLPVAE